MVMLADITGPMWYLRWTNSDDPSYFLEDPNSKAAAVVAVEVVVVFVGHGRHASAPPARMMRRKRLRPSTEAQWWRMVAYAVEMGRRVGLRLESESEGESVSQTNKGI